MKPKVSIAMPIYNEEKGVKKTVVNLAKEFEKQGEDYEPRAPQQEAPDGKFRAAHPAQDGYEFAGSVTGYGHKNCDVRQKGVSVPEPHITPPERTG